MKIDGLNLSYLKYFIDAVECQSLTKSSEINHVTRPAISQALIRLEEWAGFPLITHKKKVFELTKSGEEFFRDAKAAYQQLDVIFSGNRLQSGDVRVGCSASLAESFLVPTLRSLENLHSVSIQIGTSSQIRHLLTEGTIHLGIVIDDIKDPDIHREVIYKGRFVFASKGADFSDTLITTENRPEVLAAKSYIMKRKLRFTRQIQVESWTVAQLLSRSLSGTCLLPDFMVQSPLNSISVSGFKISFEVAVLHRGTHSLNAVEMRFLEGIRKLRN